MTVAAFSRLPGALQGALWMLLAALCFSAMTACIRHLSEIGFHPLMTSFYRSVIGLALLLPFFLRPRIAGLRTRRHRLFLFRGMASAMAQAAFFVSVAILPLADAVSLTFTAPLFGALLAVGFLGEAVDFRRAAVLLAGFAGVLIILRPGFKALDWQFAMPLAAAFGMAVIWVLVKRLSATEPTGRILFYMILYTVPVSFAMALFVWQNPTPRASGLAGRHRAGRQCGPVRDDQQLPRGGGHGGLPVRFRAPAVDRAARLARLRRGARLVDLARGGGDLRRLGAADALGGAAPPGGDRQVIPGRLRGLPTNAQGAVWILVGSLFLSANDAVVKTLGTDFHPIQMAFFRYSIGIVLLLPWFAKAGRETWRTQRVGTHFVRAAIAGVGQAAVYYAVIHLYLADATAVAFSRPLFLTLLAVLFLGETVGWRRWAATAFGFAGVLAMVRPGGSTFDTAWAVALAAAVLFALGIVLIRRLASTEPSIRILFYYHVFGIALFAGPSAAIWRPPEPDQLALLMLIGALTCAGMVCFVQGFSIGEASFVGPFEYLRLIYAALIGYWMFVEIPSVWTGVGAAMIVASAFYIARR